MEFRRTLLTFLRKVICEGTSVASFLVNFFLFALGPSGHGTKIYSGTVLGNRAAGERYRTRGMKKVVSQWHVPPQSQYILTSKDVVLLSLMSALLRCLCYIKLTINHLNNN